MIPDFLKKVVLLVCSTLAGFLVNISVVTVVIAILNYTAHDGPLFPPGLVAFALVMPVLVCLFILEAAALIYEWRTRVYLGKELLGLGLVGGLGSTGFLHRILITPHMDELNIARLAVFLGLGALTGWAVFGIHWLGNQLWKKLVSPSGQTNRRIVKG
jgi:hypothetical protein